LLNGKFLLWNNEEIAIDIKTLAWKSWFTKNILSVQDILNADGNFLTFQEFQDKFNIKTNSLQYFQLIALPEKKRRFGAKYSAIPE